MDKRTLIACLKNEAALSSTYGKGLSLSRSHAVHDIEMNDGALSNIVYITGEVSGSQGNRYAVSVQLDRAASEVLDFSCTCPAAASYPGMCKHEIALALAYLERTELGQIADASAASLGSDFPFIYQEGAFGQDVDPWAIKQTHRKSNQISFTSPTIQRILEDVANRRIREVDTLREMRERRESTESLEPAELLVTITSVHDRYYYDPQVRCIKLRVRRGGAAYVVKNMAQLINAYRSGSYVRYGKNLAFVHTPAAFSDRARAILDIIGHVIESQEALYLSRWKYQEAGRGTELKELPLPDSEIIALLDVLQGATVTLDLDEGGYGMKSKPRQLAVVEGDPTITVRAEWTGNGGCDLSIEGVICCVAADGRAYVMDEHAAHCCTDVFAAQAPLLAHLVERHGALHIAREDLPAFSRDLLPLLQDVADVQVPAELAGLKPPTPSFTFEIGLSDGRVTCNASVAYGEWNESLYGISSRMVQSRWREPESPIPESARDLAAEYRAMDAVEAYFPGGNVERGDLPGFDEDEDELLYRLMTDGLEELSRLGDVLLSERLRMIKVRPAPQITVRATVTSGLLNVALDTSGLSTQDLVAYLSAFKRKQRFVRLSDGDIVRLSEGAEAADNLARGLDVSVEELATGVGGLPASRALFVDGLLRESHGLRLSRNKAFRAIMRDFESFSDADIKPPASLAGVLRPYQLDGFRWLQMLERFGFGGILADDMGLGKTLQVITHVLACKEVDAAGGASSGLPEGEDADSCGAAVAAGDAGSSSHGGAAAVAAEGADSVAHGVAAAEGADSVPRSADSTAEDASAVVTLVVCPASLVYNWMAELNRFAPSLDAIAVVGGKRAREKIIASAAEHDVLVTSYDLMKRDVDRYEEQRFARVILDEAQHIKNPGTQVARAAKRLPARVRFALTGTPIENRVAELWSIFDFLMPGSLGSREKFAKAYEGPIESGDEQAMQRLRCLVAPFILRRTKADVLSDLPPKTESVVVARMAGEQAKLYHASQDLLVRQIAHEVPEEFKRKKLKVLAELTRLRQLCCDPALCIDDYHGGSAKLDACMELIDTALSGGHHILIFSQFTTMLGIIGHALDDRGVRYFTLTGSTSKEARRTLVNRFQAGEAPIFLISLRAGGVGLNLTAADMVIHYDPWWNVAAQNQATDRAYRIGQENAVTVFKLICADTIEERIIEMQESKRDVAEGILSGDEVRSASFTRDDVLALLQS